MKAPKIHKVTQLAAYRVHKAGYKQDTKGKCLICNGYFPDCPHFWSEVEAFIERVSTGIALGLFTTQKPEKVRNI